MIITEQEILAAFAEIVVEFTDMPAVAIKPEAHLVDDLDIDSLSMVEIVTAAQDRFSVEIPDSELKHLRTVQDVVSFVQRSRTSA